MGSKSLKIVQTKSKSKLNPKQRQSLRAIGLRGISSVAYRTDLRAMRGLLNRLQHIVHAEQVDGPVEQAKTKSDRRGVRVRSKK
ncbi:MAG: 50S ribosomal protein L30 [Bradymonadales bacterium]|nr:MAG: 50S ribosomal protein L30 [Bradymonadales bacterium]